jgi:hypothetical protein
LTLLLLKQYFLMEDTVCGKILACASHGAGGSCYLMRIERNRKMAKCEKCGKTTTFGHNRSFSLRAQPSLLPEPPACDRVGKWPEGEKDFMRQMHSNDCKDCIVFSVISTKVAA